MVVSTAHMATLASVMLRPSPAHGAMASEAYTDSHMSMEVSMEDSLTTTESGKLRPSLMHGDMASEVYTDTHMSTEVFMEDTPITTENAMLRPSRMLTSTVTMDSPMVDTWDEKELLYIGLNCNAFKQILLRKI